MKYLKYLEFSFIITNTIFYMSCTKISQFYDYYIYLFRYGNLSDFTIIDNFRLSHLPCTL